VFLVENATSIIPPLYQVKPIFDSRSFVLERFYIFIYRAVCGTVYVYSWV